MKIEESFAVKRNEDDPRWKVYIEWLRGLENRKEDEFPDYTLTCKYVGITSVTKFCIAWLENYFATIYTLDEAFERFKDKGLVIPLSSPTTFIKDGWTVICTPTPPKPNHLTREDYEKVLKEFNLFEGHKDKLYMNDINFLDSIFNPNKERIDEIKKQIERLEDERKELEG